MRKDPNIPAGTVHRLTLDSVALKTNMLGDPTETLSPLVDDETRVWLEKATRAI
ncbi:MAG: hypothetical protein WDM89_21525 [Rhizomicrobium sp.]